VRRSYLGRRRHPDHALVHITPNVLINTLMLEAAHRAKVAKFCFISSGAAYPPTADRPVREAEMFDGDPHDVYFAAGWMKRYAEILCRTYAKRFPSRCPPSWCGLPTSTALRQVRLCRQPCDGRPDPAGGRTPKSAGVWGTGEDIRDLIYVDDFIEGLLAAFAADQPYLAINICSGTGPLRPEVLQKILAADHYDNANVRYDPCGRAPSRCG